MLVTSLWNGLLSFESLLTALLSSWHKTAAAAPAGLQEQEQSCFFMCSG